MKSWLSYALWFGHIVDPHWGRYHFLACSSWRCAPGISIPVMRPRVSEWPRQGYRFPAGANAQNRLSASTASAAIRPPSSVLSRQKRSGSCRPDGSRRRTWSARSSNRPDSRPAIPESGGIRGARRSVVLVLITCVLRIHRIAQGNPPITANGIHAAWTSRAIRDWKTPKVSPARSACMSRSIRLASAFRESRGGHGAA
jgi:hypothetical protein